MPLVNKTFSDIITFTRASTATYFDSAGVLQSAANDAPRLDYDPATLLPRGFLVEEQRTNLLTYSEQFDNAAWTKTNSSITANTIVAPDGTLTGDKLVENTANGQHALLQTVSASASTTYTWSVYLKAAERFSGRLRIADNTVFIGQVAFDLTTATVTTTGSVTSPSIVSVGNGWYRVSCVAPLTASATSTNFQIFLYDASGTEVYTGDGISGLYIWGAQIEVGAFPTSYIPTTTTALTRAADVASVNTLSPWFNAAEGTLYGEVSSAARTVSGTSRRIANLNDGTESDRITVAWAGATSVGAAFVSDGGVTQAGFNSPSGAYPFPTKVALAYKTDDFQAAVNGSAFAADTSGTVPTVTQMRIGDVVTGGAGLQNLNGHVTRILYYPRRLSQAELQALTT